MSAKLGDLAYYDRERERLRADAPNLSDRGIVVDLQGVTASVFWASEGRSVWAMRSSVELWRRAAELVSDTNFSEEIDGRAR